MRRGSVYYNLFRLFISIALIHLCYLSPHAQHSFKNPYSVTEGDGLPSNFVTVVEEDEHGFAWIGTQGGLARYDGSRLQTFLFDEEDSTTIQSGYIFDIESDLENNKVWVAHFQGLSVYDVKKNEFKTYHHDPNDVNSITKAKTYRILKDQQGDIWLAMFKGGLLRYRVESDDFEHFDQCMTINTKFGLSICESGVASIVEDATTDSILWIGANGLTRFNKYTGEYHSYSIDFRDKRKDRYANIAACLLALPNEKIFYGTDFYGLFALDTRTGRISQITPCFHDNVTEIKWNQIISLTPKSNDEFWINTIDGLMLYNIGKNCIIESYQNTEENWYSVGHIDSNDRIWSASRSSGFQIFNPLLQQSRAMDYENPGQKLLTLTNKIIEDTLNRKLYVSAMPSRGLFIQDQRTGNWECVPPPRKYDLNQKVGFLSMDIELMDDGTILILEDQSLYYYQQGFKTLRPYPMQLGNSHASNKNILKHSDGTFWLSLSLKPGLVRLDPMRQTLQSFEKGLGAISNTTLRLSHLTEDSNGNIWIQDEEGMVVYNYGTGEFLYKEYDDQVMPLHSPNKISKSDNNGGVWIATGTKYLAYTHADSLDSSDINYYGKDEGLQGTEIWNIELIEDRLLVFTNVGVQWFDIKSKTFLEHYDHSYVLTELDGTTSILASGDIAFSHDKVIRLFNPKLLKSNREAPKAYISSFSVLYEERNIQKYPSANDSIYLAHNENSISFGFSAIGYNLSDKTTFRYKLGGFDEKWHDGTERKFQSYTNLPGGDYTFLVEAVNNEGISQDKATHVFLHISTVWWQTIWFKILAALLTITLGYLIYQWRLNQVRQNERIKSEYQQNLKELELQALRSQMNPHFLYNSLNSIQHFIIKNQTKEAVSYLDRFSRLVRFILQNSRQNRIPLKDELESLRLYLDLESIRFRNKFEYDIIVDENINVHDTEIPPMLIQPFIENAILHGMNGKKEKGKITLSINEESENLICIIEDNGIGREASLNHKSTNGSRKSMGMSITKNRLATINTQLNTNASLRVEDLADSNANPTGTRVIVEFPI